MLERSKAAFAFLFKDKGFRITEDTGVDEKSFGNWLWEAESPDFKLRCINDRDFVSVEIGSNTSNNEWFDLRVVKSLVLDEDTLQMEDYNEQALFLEQHYSTLATMFNSQNISETILRLEKFIDEWQRRERPSWFKS
jgi:hypothetical protein